MAKKITRKPAAEPAPTASSDAHFTLPGGRGVAFATPQGHTCIIDPDRVSGVEEQGNSSCHVIVDGVRMHVEGELAEVLSSLSGGDGE